MSGSLLCRNLLTYSLQIGFLIATAAAVPWITGLKLPKWRLLYWQAVLLGSLLLPAIRSWKQSMAEGSVSVITGFTVVAQNGAAQVVLPRITAAETILLLIAAGLLLRICRLAMGLWRLRRYRINSWPLEPASAWGHEADLRVSAEISSPVTFGVRHPVILLPAGFSALNEPLRDAMLCHEILHVRRRDWLFTIAEEIVRSAFWFHPAIWWLLAEIQLSREQAVDAEAIRITASPECYVDALLEIAGATPDMSPALAPLFLRRRHLKQRIVSILQEVRMSKTRTVSALAASIAMLAVSCWFITGALPLQAEPQSANDAPGVTVGMNGAQVIHRTSVAYPPSAAMKRIQGTVVAQVRLDATGNVVDASVLSGPDELRKPVLESVLNWHFSHDSALSTRQVSVSFVLPEPADAGVSPAMSGQLGGAGGGVASRAIRVAPGPAAGAASAVIQRILITGLSDQDRTELLSKLPVQEGGTFTPAQAGLVGQAIRDFDEHLLYSFTTAPKGEMSIVISTPVSRAALSIPPPPPPLSAVQGDTAGPKPIRVGGQVASANLVSQVPPVYPQLAKDARVQGTVTFEATIGADGHMQRLHLVSGPPLLVQAAMQAAQQWVYKPTLLNGNPVEVVTTIDIHFTLAQ